MYHTGLKEELRDTLPREATLTFRAEPRTIRPWLCAWFRGTLHAVHAKRMQNSANGIMMEPIPVELFERMCKKVVELNARFIPPYGTGSSLYLRPLEIGIEPRVGVNPATEYLFIIFATLTR